ncbi:MULTISPECIES: hypothetical protein [Bacillus]|uniref:hypothetical protein n=1 Tax=Bacillus TaxID=1386 RepID=UPI0003069882|nr:MULTISPECIES: hypothetical protein [Bacillus]
MLIWFNADGTTANVQVKFVKTIVGWFNVYHIASGKVVNLSPEIFGKYFGGVDKRVKMGCAELSEKDAVKLFGKIAKIVQPA